jgi:hypothetical protein
MKHINNLWFSLVCASGTVRIAVHLCAFLQQKESWKLASTGIGREFNRWLA